MTDYISREAAFDALFSQFCASSDETETALNNAIEEIKSIPAADVRPKWISVEDELPKEWWPVLGLISFLKEDEKGEQVLWYCGSGLWRSVWNADKIESAVTHWMPLPEPPNCGAKMEVSDA